MWIVCQIGAREHYAIPRALHRTGLLAALVTDAWIPPHSLLGRLPAGKRLRDRWHEDLNGVGVMSPNAGMLAFEIRSKLLRRGGWRLIMERNRFFQKQALAFLTTIEIPKPGDSEPPVLFSYSYAALELFREAKKRGWTTVLGQIDPGPGEDAIVNRLREKHPEWAGGVESSPPAEYWKLWREECELADRIVVNSEWSRILLAEAGVDSSKIEIIPLALDELPSPEPLRGRDSQRSAKSPLRLLFLGQAIVRKGIQDLATATGMLPGGMWEIDVVGPHGPLPENLPECLYFHGSVPRSEVAKWYAAADVFVLPTHSDGFALTQLEAMAHGLPVIATPCCGEVVVEGVNGWVIPPGEPEQLADLLSRIAQEPQILDGMRIAAKKTAAKFNLQAVSDALIH